MAFTNVWNDAVPADSQLASLGAQDFRNFRVDVQQRMAAISGLDAALPDFGSDDTPANWTGILFFATDTGKIYQWSGSAWVDLATSILKPAKYYSTTNPLCTLIIPAANLQIGTVIQYDALCVTTALGKSTVTIESTTSTATTNLVDSDTMTPGSFACRVTILFSAVGAGGVMYSIGSMGAAATVGANNAVNNSVAIDTTGGVTIYVANAGAGTAGAVFAAAEVYS